MDYWIIVLQIAQTETPPIDENSFIGLSGLPKKGFFVTNKNFFYKSPADFT